MTIVFKVALLQKVPCRSDFWHQLMVLCSQQLKVNESCCCPVAPVKSCALLQTSTRTDKEDHTFGISRHTALFCKLENKDYVHPMVNALQRLDR